MFDVNDSGGAAQIAVSHPGGQHSKSRVGVHREGWLYCPNRYESDFVSKQLF